MKKITLLLFVVAAGIFSSNAQTLKFGHINTSEAVALMSERDSAVVKLDTYRNELLEEMEAMQTEFNTKYNTYQQKAASWTQTVRESKEAELTEINQRLQQFQQSAQQDLAQMEQTLMMPIYQKAQEAINKVAKAKDLLYVFDLSAGTIVYKNDAVSIDILPDVKKELGIPAEKVAPTQLPQTTK
ncbi:MAG: OmpH family outer membrane protein [Bacteroidales bacterium]|nr:OmpH family outer membrane protein [Bacteroidales bacterium]